MTKLMIVDGNSLANRAYYGVPALSNSKGVVTNAVYGFMNMLNLALEQVQPDKLLIAFDAGKIVFRHEQYEAYKATRKRMPEDLASQMTLIKAVLDRMGVASFSLDGYEADDIIGTLSVWGEKNGYDSTIVSGDRDTFQLISEKTRVFYPKRGLSDVDIIDLATLKDDYDLTPQGVIELKGLMGDSSDNIPGVPGIGIKTAKKLLEKYGSIENLYANLADFKGKKMGEKLKENRAIAFLSKELATIDCDVPIDIDNLGLDVRPPDLHGLLSLYKELELNNLAKALEARYSTASLLEESDDTTHQGTTIDDDAALDAFLADIEPDKLVLLTKQNNDQYDVFIRQKGKNWHLPTQEGWPVLKKMESLLSDAKTHILTDDAKKLCHSLYDADVDASRVAWDAVLTDYLLFPEGKAHTVERMVDDYFNARLPEDPLQAAFATCYWLEELQPLVRQALDRDHLYQLYSALELPLAAILAEMELDGVRVNVPYLVDLQKEFGERLETIQEQIYALAGEPFNINSPKQLGRILFEVLGLTPLKKNKTGYSTNAEVLEALKNDHEIIQAILSYRQISKLQNTYVFGLLDLVDDDGKVHTTFNQTITATGRLSSTEPNLQNIPIRTEEGKRIRQAIMPGEKEQVLVSADYSQIELRVLAHMSQDEGLMESFKNGEDIHRRTASEVFHIDMDQVDADMRRTAKAVNFGIIYGQTDYGLSRELGISRKEAKAYIERYFDRYPAVKAFIDATIADAREKGYVTTLLERRRHIRDIHSKNHSLRSFAERTAVNAPIQGTAADIIKLAMLECDRQLRENEFSARMILQVHDELVFEAPPEEVAYLIQTVTSAMENAMILQVPLKSDIKVGFNWNEMEPVHA